MKRAVLNLMLRVGVFAAFRMANRSKALVLTYHRFSESGEEDTTSERAFAEQMEYLSEHYKVVPLSLLAQYLRSGPPLVPDMAAVTIDDGYRDAYDVAFPILRRFNLPATVFAVTEFADRRGWLWTDKLPFITVQTQARELHAVINGCVLQCELNDRPSRLQAAERVNQVLKRLPDEVKEEAINRIASSLGVRLPDLPPAEFSPLMLHQLREMDAAGVEIGSHTVTHPILTNVGEERLRYELQESKSFLEAVLGRKVDLFCYPNGDYDSRVQREVENAGYRCAVSCSHGFNDANTPPLTVRRIHGERDMVHFLQSTSGFEEVKNRLRAVGRMESRKRSRWEEAPSVSSADGVGGD